MMSRIDVIGQNGNDGDHYEAFSVCEKCGEEISGGDLQISKTACHQCRAEEAKLMLNEKGEAKDD